MREVISPLWDDNKTAGGAAKRGEREMKLLFQIALAGFLCLAGELVAMWLPFPFSPSVMSMILLLTLFLTGLLKVEKMRELCTFILANMAFFYVSSLVSVIEHYEVIAPVVLKFLLLCIVTTVLTFAATAYTVTFVIRLMGRKGAKIR